MAMSYIKMHYDWREMTQDLSDQEMGALIRALLDYAADRDVCPLVGGVKLLFSALKCQVDRDREKYRKVCQERSRSAKIRWERQECKCIEEKEQEQEQEQEKEQERGEKREEQKNEPDCAGRSQEEPPVQSPPSPPALPQSPLLEELEGMLEQPLSQDGRGALAFFAREMGPECCRQAVRLAGKLGAPRFSYVRAILNRKWSQGVRSLADWDRVEQERMRTYVGNMEPRNPKCFPDPALAAPSEPFRSRWDRLAVAPAAGTVAGGTGQPYPGQPLLAAM